MRGLICRLATFGVALMAVTLLASCDNRRSYAHACVRIGDISGAALEQVAERIATASNLQLDNNNDRFTKRQREAGVMELIATSASRSAVHFSRFDFGAATVCVYPPEEGGHNRHPSDELDELFAAVKVALKMGQIDFEVTETRQR